MDVIDLHLSVDLFECSDLITLFWSSLCGPKHPEEADLRRREVLERGRYLSVSCLSGRRPEPVKFLLDLEDRELEALVSAVPALASKLAI